MAVKKRKPLGPPLPALVDFPAPGEDELNRLSAQWNSIVPAKWRGMLDAQPLGSEVKSAFYYDEVRRVLYRANGQVVSVRERLLAYEAFQEVIRK